MRKEKSKGNDDALLTTRKKWKYIHKFPLSCSHCLLDYLLLNSVKLSLVHICLSDIVILYQMAATFAAPISHRQPELSQFSSTPPSNVCY